MKYARLFRENEEPILVSAEQVKEGLYSRDEEFVDPEYEYRVRFVKGAKNNGGPYFRLYHSYEEYKKLFPERASRYEIVANMRRYQECKWHRMWKDKVSGFCNIEKCIKNPRTGKWKFADAYYEMRRICIEFQHSYIAWDFEERNAFYAELSIDTIWLYDLSNANIRQDELGRVQILEDNARGFFRISENLENLKKHPVYVQVKNGNIYRVKELYRLPSSAEYQSTIRYFLPSEIYAEEEFITAVRLGKIRKRDETEKVDKNRAYALAELWKPQYSWMIVENIHTGERISINHNGNGEMFRDFKTGCIKHKYADNKYEISTAAKKEYCLSYEKEQQYIWRLISYKIK